MSLSMVEPTAWLGATMTPPSPASPAPITKTVVKSSLTLTPVVERSWESATAARMLRPKPVR